MNIRCATIFCFGMLAALYAFFIVEGALSQTASPEESYQRGLVLANQYECVRAIAEFDKAITVNPSDPRYYLGRANCRLHQLANMNAHGEDAETVSAVTAIIDGDLSAAIKADSKYALAYFERAKTKQRLLFKGAGVDPASVLSDFDKAIELEPENLEFLRERAHFLLIDLKDEELGLEDMARLIKREPKDPGHLFVRGRFFLEAGRYSEAINDLSNSLRLDPSDRFARILRAKAYFRSNNYEATLADLNVLVKFLDRGVSILDGVWVLETRAIIHRKQGKKALAAADERRLKRLKREVDDNDPE